MVATGLGLGLIGMAGSALGVLNPNPLAPIINTGEHAGLVFIAAGMIVWGVLAVRTSVLGRWSAVPIAIGVLGLSGLTFLWPAAFATLEGGVVPLVFSGSWTVLGYALLTQTRSSGTRDAAAARQEP